MDTINTLDRVAFELGPLTVYWYGIIIGVGILLGLMLAINESKKVNLDPNIFTDLIIWAIPVSILFARLYYVSFEWEYYSRNPTKIIAIWEGGIAIHGALTGAMLTAILFCHKKGVSFWKIADIAAPSLILAQAIGRWGNFMNQEAHGTEVSRNFLESLYLPDFIIDQMFINGSYFHPTFLYESLWNVMGFIFLIIIRKWVKGLKQGEIFLLYLAWYSVGRFFIEGLRTDSLMLTDNIRIAQVLSLVLVGLSLSLIFYRRKKYNLVLYHQN
jgi:phosphatidylglycerol---prolipoprotein diacylglyceryl transferase